MSDPTTRPIAPNEWEDEHTGPMQTFDKGTSPRPSARATCRVYSKCEVSVLLSPEEVRRLIAVAEHANTVVGGSNELFRVIEKLKLALETLR